MNTVIRGTYGKTRNYAEMDRLPNVGDEWIGRGYEDAKVVAIAEINDEVAETTSGDPTADYTFYRITVAMGDDEFVEYVAIPGGYATEIEKAPKRHLSYVPLWKTLVEKRIKKSDLIKDHIVAPGTLGKMVNDEPVSVASLMKICDALDVDLSDVVEYTMK